MTVNAAVQINTTGSAVNQTIATPGGTVNLALASSSTHRVFSGTASFTFGSFATLSGNFSFSSVNTGVQTKLFIGLANVTGTANDGSTAASLTGGSLGLVIFWNNVTGLTPGYALSATGTVNVLSGAGTATATISRNTTASVVNETVSVGSTNITISFTTAQTKDPTSGAPYQNISIGNIGTPFPALNGLLAGLTISVGTDGVTGTVAPTTFDHLMVGDFLELDSVTVGGTLTLSSGKWTGSLSISATAAILFPNQSFSATVVIKSGSTITYASDGSFSMNLQVGFKLTLGEALQVTAGDPTNATSPGVTLAYDSSQTGEQTLVDFGTTNLTATSPQFGVSGTIAGLVIYNDGFKFTSVSLTATNVQLGSILSADSITLALNNGPFIVTYGSGNTPASIGNNLSTSTPTLSLSITNLKLFPVGGFITTKVGGINAYYDFSGFDGSTPSGVLRLAITDLTITLGDSIRVAVPSVTITPDQLTLASIPTATVDFPLFNGLGAVTLANFQLLQTGFNIGSLNLSSPAGITVNLGGVLSFGSLSASVSNFSFNYGSGISSISVSGSINIQATNLTLFPSLNFLSAKVATVTGTYSFSTTGLTPGEVLSLSLGNLNIYLGGMVNINVPTATITPGQLVVADFSAATVTASASILGVQFGGTITGLKLLQTGLQFNTATLNFSATGGGNSYLSFSGGSVTLAGPGGTGLFAVNYNQSSPVSGTVSASLTGLQLFPGSSLISASGDATATFDFSSPSATGRLTVTVPTFSLTLGGVLKFTASNVNITPDGLLNDNFSVNAGDLTETLSQTVSNSSQVSVWLTTGTGAAAVQTLISTTQYTITGNQLTFNTALTQTGTLTVVYPPVIATVGNATATILPLNVSATISGLTILKTGVTLTSASVNLPDVVLDGGLFTINTPALSFNNIVFTLGTGGSADSLTGTARFTSTGAALNLGGGYSLAINHNPLNTGDSPANLALSGDYDLSTKALQLSLEHITSTLPLVSLDATNVIFRYTPSTSDDSATMLLGAKNVTLTAGSSGVGLQVSNATFALEVFKASTANGGATSYALDATGNVALIGLPANSLTLSGQMEVKIDNLPGAGTTGVQVQVGTAATDTVMLGLSGSLNKISGTNVILGVGGVVTATGNFTVTTGGGQVLVSVSNVNAFLGTTDGSMGLKISGGNLGFILNSDGTYAVDATASTVSLIGFNNFTLTGSVELQVNTATAAIDLSTLNGSLHSVTGGTALNIGGTLTLQITNFVSLQGAFTFTQTTPVTFGTMTTSELDVVATGVTAFMGYQDPNNAANNKGVKLVNGKLGLVLIKKNNTALTVQAAATYALTASGTASLVGFSDFGTLTASLQVRANTTGAALTRTLSTSSGSVLLNFADGSLVTDIDGSVTSLTVANFVSLSGNFSFSQTVNPTQATLTKILVGATNVTATWGSSPGVQLTNGQLALALYNDTSLATPGSYALDASGTLAVTGIPALAFSGTFDARINTRTVAVNETINVGGSPVALVFAAGTGSTASITGTDVSLAVAGFASVSGNFNLTKNGSDFDLSATNVSASVGVTQGSGSSATFTGIQITGASLGLLIRSGGYAVVASGGTDSIVGIPGLTVSATGLTVRVNTLGAIAADPVVGTFTGNETDVTGTVTWAVSGFASLTGSFSFQKTTDAGTQVTTFVVGASNVTATLGTSTVNLTVQYRQSGIGHPPAANWRGHVRAHRHRRISRVQRVV